MLELHQTYLISRAVINKIDLKYKPSGENEHDCEMIIKNHTHIEEAADNISGPPAKEFKFVPLCTLPELTSPPPQIGMLSKFKSFKPAYVGNALRNLHSACLDAFPDIVGIVLGISQEEKRKRKRDSMEISFREIILTDAG